jgi:riboflavin transporter FmnP
MRHIKKKIHVSRYYRKTAKGKRIPVRAHETIIPKLYGLAGTHDRHRKKKWNWVPLTKNTLIAGLVTAIIYEMAALISCLYGSKWAKEAIFIPWCFFDTQGVCTILLLGPISNFIATFLMGAAAMWMWENRNTVKKMKTWFRGGLIGGFIGMTVIIVWLILSHIPLFRNLYINIVLQPCYLLTKCEFESCVFCFYFTPVFWLIIVMTLGIIIGRLSDKLKEKIRKDEAERGRRKRGILWLLARILRIK